MVNISSRKLYFIFMDTRQRAVTPSTPASHIEGAADGGNVTLYTAGVVLSSNDHKGHATREQSS